MCSGRLNILVLPLLCVMIHSVHTKAMAGDPNAGMSQPLRALLGEKGAGRNKTDNNNDDSASTVRATVPTNLWAEYEDGTPQSAKCQRY